MKKQKLKLIPWNRYSIEIEIRKTNFEILLLHAIIYLW